jgi:hypothetical protein
MSVRSGKDQNTFLSSQWFRKETGLIRINKIKNGVQHIDGFLQVLRLNEFYLRVIILHSSKTKTNIETSWKLMD